MEQDFKLIAWRSRENHCISHEDAMLIKSAWLEARGTGGCYYPNVSEWDMLTYLLAKGII